MSNLEHLYGPHYKKKIIKLLRYLRKTKKNIGHTSHLNSTKGLQSSNQLVMFCPTIFGMICRRAAPSTVTVKSDLIN